MERALDTAGICLECAIRAPTCCRLSGESGAQCFPLSLPERERIEEILKQHDFWESEKNSEAFLSAMGGLFPTGRSLVDKRWPFGQKHDRLRTHGDGACVLLTPAGCILPAEARPHHCRIYPFWIYNGQITYFEDQQCLAASSCRSLADLLRMFSLGKKEIFELYRRICLDWGLDGEILSR